MNAASWSRVTGVDDASAPALAGTDDLARTGDLAGTGDPAGTGELQETASRIFESWRHLVNGPAREVSAAFYGEGDDACEAAQVEALEVLLDGEGLRMTDLARRVRVEASTMTRTVDRMIKHGLVERTSHPGDDRFVVVRTTTTGAQRCHRILRARARIMREYVVELGERDAEVLATLMERFVEGVARTVERHREATP